MLWILAYSVSASLFPNCSHFTECTSCYNASYLCHWCNTTTPTKSPAASHDVTASNKTRSVSNSACFWRGNSDCKAVLSCTDDSSCSKQPNCTECEKNTLCHWCSDMKCHTVGSLYGCAVGLGCYDNSECIRKKPEFHGYAGSPFWVWLLFLIGCVTLCCCGTCMQGLCYRIKEAGDRGRGARNYEETIRELRAEVAALTGNTNVVPAAREAEETPGDTEEQNDAEESSEAPPADVSARQMRRQESTEARTNLIDSIHRTGLVDDILDAIIHRVFRGFCIMWSILIPVGCLLLFISALHVPHKPIISYCNRQTEWKKLINNVISVAADGKVGADFELLLSMYNPNRVSIDVSSIRGQLQDPDSGVNVGTIALAPFNAEAGSIVDMLATVSMSADRWEALGMATKWYKGNLVFRANIDLAFDINAYGLSLYSSDYTQQQSIINASQPLGQEYCHCNTPQQSMNEKRAML